MKKNVYKTILSNDLDSLFGCKILETVMGWKIAGCMLFKDNYYDVVDGKDEEYLDFIGVTDPNIDTRLLVGVDLDLRKGKSFGNHVTMLNSEDEPNEKCVNISNYLGKHRDIYKEKYNLSTTLMIWDIYDLPKNNLTEDLMMLLLCIDGAYCSYFNPDFTERNMTFLVDILEWPELYDCETRHSIREFDLFKQRYRVYSRIWRTRYNTLNTNICMNDINEILFLNNIDIQLSLPHKKFYQVGSCLNTEGYLTNKMTKELHDESILSFALTGKNYCSYSILVDGGLELEYENSW